MNLRHLWHPPHIHPHPPHQHHIEPPPPGGLILRNISAEKEKAILEAALDEEIRRTRPLFMPVTTCFSFLAGIFVSLNALLGAFGKTRLPREVSELFALIFPGIWFAMIAVFFLMAIMALVTGIILVVMCGVWLLAGKSVNPTSAELGIAVVGGWAGMAIGIILWILSGVLT